MYGLSVWLLTFVFDDDDDHECVYPNDSFLRQYPTIESLGLL